jgi:hypothetical protein
MEVESADGRGTRVTLVAPLRRDEAGRGEADSGGERPAASPEGPRIRVLLADDHPVVREGLKGLVEGEPDMKVVGEAADGQSAVEPRR